MFYTQPDCTNFLLLCLAASLACLPRVTQCSGGLPTLHAQGSGSLAILDLEGRGISAIEAAPRRAHRSHHYLRRPASHPHVVPQQRD